MSPDGTQIAFAFGTRSRSAIYLFGLSASRRTLLVAGSAPAWSPDGNTIAYRVDCGVKLATPRGKDVTPFLGPFRCQAIGVPGTPVWSPDGKKIAIGTTAAAAAPNNLYAAWTTATKSGSSTVTRPVLPGSAATSPAASRSPSTASRLTAASRGVHPLASSRPRPGRRSDTDAPASRRVASSPRCPARSA
jgi:hypothetical protein